MSSEWPVVRLGDHIDACLGKMLDAKKNKGQPQPYLGNSNVRWGEFDLSDLAEMRFEAHEEERYSLHPGDLVVCEGGEPGRCAIWTGPPGMKVQKALHRIRPRETLNNYYLLYWLRHSAAVGLLEQHFTGTTIKHLTGKAIAALKMPLPPMAVQLTAVDMLKSLDDRITLLRETNATLEAIAQALFKSWFVDFDPVRAKIEGRTPEGMDEATAALFPDGFETSELGDVPRGWRGGALSEIALLNAQSWSTRNAPQRVTYIDLAGVKGNVFDLPQTYAFPDAPSRARRVLRSGDSIVGTVRPGNRSFGFVAEAVNSLTGSTGFAVLSPKRHAFAAFIYLCATRDENIDRLASLADGGAYPAVKPELVSATTCVFPTDEVLAKFDETARPLLDAISANSERAQALSSLRNTLLPRLISGQLRLPEAQTTTQAALGGSLHR